METKIKLKKIAFCITCMNRLCHLQETLEKNIQDNYLPDEVEFVLLDYNSTDSLEQWVQQNMQSYINSGILVYYKTCEPEHYRRSHSRNMVFCLANAEILCNLDADNFLGEGFASFMIDEFNKNDRIFYTSNAGGGDIVGRVCVRKEDFMAIKGYNETIQSYGFEDTDLFIRLDKHGLIHKEFDNPDFFNCVIHSDEERVKDEFIAKNTEKMYISYINPYTSYILLLYKDFTFARYTIIDNMHLNLYTDFTKSENKFLNEKSLIVLGNDFQQGTWHKNNDKITLVQEDYTTDFNHDAPKFLHQNQTCYAITDNDFQTQIFLILSLAINLHQVLQQQNKEKPINEQGFGKGIVFKNFNTSNAINL